jgi:GntR family transcriptional regulator
VPLSERLSRELERRISIGAHTPGAQLPAETEFCAEFDVSRPTLRDAMSRLEALGLIDRHQGRGTYVTEQRRPGISTLLEANLSITVMIEQMGLRPGARQVSASYEAPDSSTAEALRLDPSDAVLVVCRVRTGDGVPVAFSVDYLAPWIPDLPRDSGAYQGSLYELLGEHCGQPVAGAVARIEPMVAPSTVAELLQITEDDGLMALHQTHELADGRPVLYSTDYLRNDVFTVYVRRAFPPPPPDLVPHTPRYTPGREAGHDQPSTLARIRSRCRSSRRKHVLH